MHRNTGTATSTARTGMQAPVPTFAFTDRVRTKRTAKRLYPCQAVDGSMYLSHCTAHRVGTASKTLVTRLGSTDSSRWRLTRAGKPTVTL
ncbi:hypothetical protein ZHAS_00020973 [Anopheles sinensis]|uniref:Uncharacterized protein n=1 Tax=Anopheles sinensis TaxID=74873 RepID=A0A084WR71_ANOSI|nr:hypothetical protein ZHAS_00020973 [Anopheles sinensis]